MKKYILLLFMITGFMQAQTLQNPNFGNTTTNTLKVKTPATITSVNFLPAFDSDGFTVSKIDPVLLQLSTATINAINTSASIKLDKTTSPDILYGTDALGNQINYTSDFLENKQALRDFYKNLYAYWAAPTTSKIGLACWGDSVSQDAWRPFGQALFSRYQQATITYPAQAGGFSFADLIGITGTVFNSSTATIDQTIYDGTGGFADFTYLPNANHLEMSNGSTITIGQGFNGGNVTASVYFASGVGMGSAFVELLDSTGATVLNSTTVNLAGASLNVAKANFTILGTLKYRLRVTATGKVVYLMGAFSRSNGIVPISFGRGGCTLAQNNYSNKTILAYFLNEFKISLMFLQCKEENINVSLPATMTTFNTFTTTSKIIVGSAPDSSTPATQIANNNLFRTQALSNGFVYFDAYKLMKNWAEVVRLGWNADSTHLNENGYRYIGLNLISTLGLFQQIGYIERNNIDNIPNNGYVSTNTVKMNKGDASEASVDVLVASNQPTQGSVHMQSIRRIYFGDIGVEAPMLVNYTSSTLAIYNRAASAFMGLRMGTLSSEKIFISNTPVLSTTGFSVATRQDANGEIQYVPSNYYALNLLTGYVSGAGTLASTDTVLQAIQKLNGNDGLKANTASPALTGTPTAPTATFGTNTTQLATTAFVQASVTGKLTFRGLISQTGTSIPTLIVLENTTGLTMTTGRGSAGQYTIIPSVGDFNFSKTYYHLENNIDNIDNTIALRIRQNDSGGVTSGSLKITTTATTITGVTTSFDDMLVKTPIEIIIYP